MNLVSQGQTNIILNGNPSKTFFKTTYSQYTNFGLQKFRVDFEGAKTLRLNEPSTFSFKVPRYADLLMDTYLSVNLPNIWSPIMPPQNAESNKWVPYEFRWIKNLGAKMVSRIQMVCGNYTLQEYSGDYLLASVQRDFNTDKKNLFDKMSGHTPEMNDPGNLGSRVNAYPNAFYTDDVSGPEPSIPQNVVYIPLNNWFGLKSQMAFPLTALQYNELHIIVTFRPINELFQIRDVLDHVNDYPYIAPNFNSWYQQFHRFLHPPPNILLEMDSYTDKRTIWNSDIHLNCTYGFLSQDEERVFALEEQKYLIKTVSEREIHNVTGSNKVSLESHGLVSNWLFYFQRSDVNLRNEWSNYSNWPYNYIPRDIIQSSSNGDFPITRINPNGEDVTNYIGPGVNPNGKPTGWFTTQIYSPENKKDILETMGILLNGSYRENLQPAGIFNFIEKYTRTSGNAPNGLYCYNFGLHSNNSDIQPSGAINMSKFTQIELEFSTIIPAMDPLAQTLTICDPVTGEIIGVNKPTWRIYDYNFDLHIFEERINIVHFVGGNVGLLYAN